MIINKKNRWYNINKRKRREVMNKRFILIVTYGTGKATMLTKTPDIQEAIEEFKEAVKRDVPNYKEYTLPIIHKVELLPLLYTSIYEEE